MFINTVKISSEGSKYEQQLRLEQSSCRKILKKKVLRITRNPLKHSRIPIAVTAQRLKKLNCLRHSQDPKVNTYLKSTLWKINLLNS